MGSRDGQARGRTARAVLARASEVIDRFRSARRTGGRLALGREPLVMRRKIELPPPLLGRSQGRELAKPLGHGPQAGRGEGRAAVVVAHARHRDC